MAVSKTQMPPGWVLNRLAAHILWETRSGTNDSFALLSPVSGSEFMVAMDTLTNVHSQLALSVAIQGLSQFYAAGKDGSFLLPRKVVSEENQSFIWISFTLVFVSTLQHLM